MWYPPVVRYTMSMLTPDMLKARIRLAMRHPNSATPAREIIEKALEKRVYVAFSGGRCSQVTLHLVIQQDPDIPVMFNNTGVEYPETVKHVHRIAEEWNLNFKEIRPETDYWTLVKEHGFPQLRGSSKKKGRPRKPACCRYLKEEPAKRYMEEHHMDGFISGLRVEESRPRALAIYQRGPYYLAKRDGIWKFHPVAVWSMGKLMRYVKDHDIPLNPLYEKGLPRVGCMPCTGFLDWRQQLMEVNPEYYKWLNREYQKSLGEPTLWEFVDEYDLCVEDLK